MQTLLPPCRSLFPSPDDLEVVHDRVLAPRIVAVEHVLAPPTIVKGGYLGPVRVVGGAGRGGVAGGYGRLESVGTDLPEPQRRVEDVLSLTDLVSVPAVTVLLLQGHKLARPVDTGSATGVVEKHER